MSPNVVVSDTAVVDAIVVDSLADVVNDVVNVEVIADADVV